MRLCRAVLFQAYFYALTTGVCLIGGVPVRLFARHRALALAQWWIAAVLGGARVICGIRIVVTGREHLPADEAALIACQHQSAVDALLWFTLVPRPSYVMKRELTRIPIFGGLLLDAGMVPVDRGAGATALRALLLETARLAASGRQMIIFPEGTRVPPGQCVPLQPGVAAIARQTGLAVIPVGLDSGLFWGRGAFDRRAGTIHVAIRPPIPAGTPRNALLAAIEAAWRQPLAETRQPVDNPVGGSAGALKFTAK
jgi:1-acyl-sn-glycerol-3-phosphate acyltransferase